MGALPDSTRIGIGDSIAATARELKDLAAELAARPIKADVKIEYHDTGHSIDRGIEWIVKPSRKSAVLIVVNADKNPVEATLSVGGWRKNETFEPFGAPVWRVATTPQDNPTRPLTRIF
jgi:hypothetical protein